jgi:hypothetical protein
MIYNPYLNRTMIKAAAGFYGRQRELQKIFARIGSPRPQSVAIVGERRIGKSSLLYQTYLAEQRHAYVPDPERLFTIFLDLSTRKDFTVSQVFQTIFDGLGQEFSVPPGKETSSGYDQFQAVVEQMETQGRRLVIFFDEFEAIASNPNIPTATVTEFLAFLRGIANSRPVAYVTSSQADLQELGHSGEIKESPFFNIFTRISLGPLQADEALRLIGEPSAAAGRDLAPYAPVVMEWAGTHPYFLQIACAALFDQHDGREISATGLAEARHEFSEQAEDQFQYIWQRLSDDERVVLRALAAGERLPPQKAFAQRGLERRGYVQARGGQPAVFSTIFAERIPEWDAMVEPPTARAPADIYAALETQAVALLARLGPGHPDYREALVFQAQLVQNLVAARGHGDTDSLRADRNRIIGELTALGLRISG